MILSNARKQIFTWHICIDLLLYFQRIVYFNKHGVWFFICHTLQGHGDRTVVAANDPRTNFSTVVVQGYCLTCNICPIYARTIKAHQLKSNRQVSGKMSCIMRKSIFRVSNQVTGVYIIFPNGFTLNHMIVRSC